MVSSSEIKMMKDGRAASVRLKGSFLFEPEIEFIKRLVNHLKLNDLNCFRSCSKFTDYFFKLFKAGIGSHSS